MTAIRTRRHQRGFTLTELLVGIALWSVFMLAVYGFYDSSLRTYSAHQNQSLAQDQARVAMNALTSQLRQTVSPDNGITPPVVVLSPTEIEFYADMSRSINELVPKPEEFLYQITNGNLVRQIAQPVGASPPYSYGAFSSPDTLITSIANGTSAPLFSAVNEEGVALGASIAAPATVGISLITVNMLVGYAIGNSTAQFALRTDIAPLNPTAGNS
jgi:prepilin-type N-terminal cleavage/methylation domain-containing protein